LTIGALSVAAQDLSGTNYNAGDSSRSEQLSPDGSVKGQYSYTDPNGKLITVKYTAGKDGFKVEGDHLPKAPQPQPAPQQQYNQQPQQYNQQPQQYNPQPQQYNSQPQQFNPQQQQFFQQPQQQNQFYNPQPQQNQFFNGQQQQPQNARLPASTILSQPQQQYSGFPQQQQFSHPNALPGQYNPFQNGPQQYSQQGFNNPGQYQQNPGRGPTKVSVSQNPGQGFTYNIES